MPSHGRWKYLNPGPFNIKGKPDVFTVAILPLIPTRAHGRSDHGQHSLHNGSGYRNPCCVGFVLPSIVLEGI
jgi:hypothetical protein